MPECNHENKIKGSNMMIIKRRLIPSLLSTTIGSSSRRYQITPLLSFSTTTTTNTNNHHTSHTSGTSPHPIVHIRSSLKAHENRLIPLLPQSKQPLTWYACGPTVYDVAHLGHARNYVTTDILRRILVHHFHYQVNFVLGMTDVDDKIIRRGKEANCLELSHFLYFARKYENEFFRDMDHLLVNRPSAVLRVTEHIPEIINFIQRLIDQGFAYTTSDGVYFKFSALPKTYNPNKFGNLPDVELDTEGRGGEHDKQDPRDFALWKASPESEVVGWKSPFGYGRPGWHIECSAMTHAYFGEHLDIHSGGIDLKFPHHTNEILQSECHNCHASHEVVGEKEWVKAWIHTGHLHIEGRKMSKSLKNFISIDDYWQSQLTSSPAEDFRLFCLHHKYSALLTYTPKHIELAEQYRKKLLDFFAMIQVIQTTIEATTITTTTTNNGQGDNIRRMFSCKPSPSSRALMEMLIQTEVKVTEALANDFDTPTALILVNQLLTEGQKYIIDLRQQVFHQIREEEGVEMEWLAIEPLKAVEGYIRTLFSHSFGIPLYQESTVGGGSDAVLSKDNNDNAFIDAAVDFRSRIRAMAIHGLKALKTKANKSVEEEQLYKQLLQECDVARDRMLKEGKVKVEDLGVGQGKWSRDL